MFRFLLLCLFLSSSLFSSLLDEQGCPTAPLLALFDALQTPHDGTLKSLCESSQKLWDQQGERWTFETRFEDQREVILPLLEEIGCFQRIEAKKNHYHYAIVLGALVVAVQKRIGFLVEEWERGVRFDEIVFLTGQRPLHSQKEAHLLRKAKTERDVMALVWAETPMPEKLRALPLTIVDAPPAPGRTRPTTASTVQAWMEEKPEPGSCLAFSSQPYVGYQSSVLTSLLPPSFSIEAAGPEGGRTYKMAVLVDTLAKWIYFKAQEKKH